MRAGKIVIALYIILIGLLAFSNCKAQNWLQKVKNVARDVNKAVNPPAQPAPTAKTNPDTLKPPRTVIESNAHPNTVAGNQAATGMPDKMHAVTMPFAATYNLQDTVTYNGKLYFQCVNAAGAEFVAVYDGSSMKMIPFPDAITAADRKMKAGFFEMIRFKPVAFHNKIYFPTYTHDILEFDGTAVQPIPKDNPKDAFRCPFVIKDQLFFSVVHEEMNEHYNRRNDIARYDGKHTDYLGLPENIIFLPAPGGLGFPVIANNRIYFTSTVSNFFSQFDGNRISRVDSNSMATNKFGVISAAGPFVCNKVLFFWSMVASVTSSGISISDGARLLSFDGHDLRIISTPGEGEASAIQMPPRFSAMYNNKLYVPLFSGIAVADGDKITSVPKDLMEGMPVVYNNKLCFLQNGQLMLYDGNGYKAAGKITEFNNPIVCNNKLYFSSGTILYAYDGTAIGEVYDNYPQHHNLSFPFVVNNKLCFGDEFEKQILYLDEATK